MKDQLVHKMGTTFLSKRNVTRGYHNAVYDVMVYREVV